MDHRIIIIIIITILFIYIYIYTVQNTPTRMYYGLKVHQCDLPINCEILALTGG